MADKQYIQLHVESDGTLGNTFVKDQHGRELICRSVDAKIEGGRKSECVSVVTLELYDVPFSIVPKRRRA